MLFLWCSFKKALEVVLDTALPAALYWWLFSPLQLSLENQEGPNSSRIESLHIINQSLQDSVWDIQQMLAPHSRTLNSGTRWLLVHTILENCNYSK